MLNKRSRQKGGIFSFIMYTLISMRLDGKMIQDAIKQLIAEYKYDPYQVLDIVKM